MDPSLATPNLTIPAYASSSRPSYTRSNSLNSPRVPTTPTGQPRLSDVTEAFLLRHFQRHLAPWVGSFLCRILRLRINPSSLMHATRDDISQQMSSSALLNPHYFFVHVWQCQHVTYPERQIGFPTKSHTGTTNAVSQSCSPFSTNLNSILVLTYSLLQP